MGSPPIFIWKRFESDMIACIHMRPHLGLLNQEVIHHQQSAESNIAAAVWDTTQSFSAVATGWRVGHNT